MTLRQWDVWRVDWHHQGADSKPRPAVLISGEADAGNGVFRFLKVSKQPHPDADRNVYVPLNSPSATAAGFTRDSYIHLAIPRVVGEADLIGPLGRLDAETVASVTQAMLALAAARRARGT